LCQNYCKREAADTDLGELKTKCSDSQWNEEKDADGNLVAGKISQPPSCHDMLWVVGCRFFIF
jgi:hypothetical protein